MGKILVIKNADFSVNAILKTDEDRWHKLALSNGNWLPNYVKGGKLIPGTRDDTWASQAISIDGYTKMCGLSSTSQRTQVMFYSDLPTTSTAESLYVGVWRGLDDTDPIYTKNSPGIIPPGAKYAIIFDQGTGANTYGITSAYYVYK